MTSHLPHLHTQHLTSPASSNTDDQGQLREEGGGDSSPDVSLEMRDDKPDN